MNHHATILATGLRFPEGPAFDDEGTLWAVELQGGALIRLTDQVERIDVGGAPNGLAFRNGAAWFCDADAGAIRRLSRDGLLEVVVSDADGVGLDRPNDLAFDALGNLVFTCPGNSRHEPLGTVWCRTIDGRMIKVADGLYFPNGLAFSGDGQSLVIAETYRHRLWKGSWDPQQCCWSNARVWAEVGGPIGPDGMAFAQSGALYVAVFDQGEIVKVGPDGIVVQRIALTGRRPTNVAFRPGSSALVFTEAERGEIGQIQTADISGTLFI